ncbi:MAG: hypothetical protein IPJ06_03020 [Saprospiraceae bacterium]|nr:hypothetical protein [Saprospiraceae bacterium]
MKIAKPLLLLERMADLLWSLLHRSLITRKAAFPCDPKKWITLLSIHITNNLQASVKAGIGLHSHRKESGSHPGNVAFQDTVGPGGFMDIVYGAKVVVFVGSWHANAQYAVKSGRVIMVKSGKPKFVRQVDQVTFLPEKRYDLEDRVLSVSHVGIFKLSPEGPVLTQIAPGIDVQRDIVQDV